MWSCSGEAKRGRVGRTARLEHVRAPKTVTHNPIDKPAAVGVVWKHCACLTCPTRGLTQLFSPRTEASATMDTRRTRQKNLETSHNSPSCVHVHHPIVLDVLTAHMFYVYMVASTGCTQVDYYTRWTVNCSPPSVCSNWYGGKESTLPFPRQWWCQISCAHVTMAIYVRFDKTREESPVRATSSMLELVLTNVRRFGIHQLSDGATYLRAMFFSNLNLRHQSVYLDCRFFLLKAHIGSARVSAKNLTQTSTITMIVNE